ncbi:hypothetical protein [Actinoplanes sp. NPDC049599]|uniref:hypothetical protein n=1 Tax=Actinoplanes sp. NPDC049599 TaxID=3363903 RepID=UPI0037B3E104
MTAHGSGRPLTRITHQSIGLLRRAVGLPALAVVEAVCCPRCRMWVAPRRFDLRHMACRTCMRTLARPARLGRGWR